MPFFKSASSLLSDSSDVDLEGLAESELAKLQRQFRLLEGNRHTYALQSRETIRRQQVEIRRLEKENEDLLRRQGVIQGRANRQHEKIQGETLRSLLAKRDEVKQQITAERKQIAQLDKEIQSLQKSLAEQKQVVGSEALIQEQTAQLLRRIQTAENQLDKVSTEFNSQLVLNSQLREDLEILRVGHSHFEQLYKNLEKELLDTRKAIGAMISSSAAAYDARDEAQTRLVQLQDKAEKDLRQHDFETKELDRIIENDRCLSEFIATKLQERTLSEEALKAKEKKEEERRLKDPDEEMLESYNNTMDKIAQITGSSNLNAALNKYAKNEEWNFAQFSYVNEQNNQKEQLWEEIKKLRHEIEEVQKQESQKEMERQSRLRELEAKQEDAVQEGNKAELKLKAQNKVWELLKNAIESLFWKLKCDHSALENLLGGTTTARDENVVTYLSLIEQKTNELLAMYSFLRAEQKDEPYDSTEVVQLILGQTPEIRPHAFNLRPPTAGHGHEPIMEEDQKPLTHAELKEKIMNDMRNKAAGLSVKKTTLPEAQTAHSGSGIPKK